MLRTLAGLPEHLLTQEPDVVDRTARCITCDVTFVLNTVGRPTRQCEACRPTAWTCIDCGVPVNRLTATHCVGTKCPRCSKSGQTARLFECPQCECTFEKPIRGGYRPRDHRYLCPRCEVTHKWCPGCRVTRRVSEFHKGSKRNDLHNRCRACILADYHAGSYEDRRKRALLKTYGITLEQYRAMEQRQNFACAICRTPTEQCSRAILVVDHDHRCCPATKSCGRCVRALLCRACNFALGHFSDKIDRVEAAAAYLRQYA